MRPRVLAEALGAYRIGDPDGEFPVWSAEGAKRVQGRWHATGQEVICASEHYSTALLEKLAQCNGILPPNQHFVEATIPQGVTYEVVSGDSLPGWSGSSGASARAFGSQWYRDLARNRIVVGLEVPVWWDHRLFGNPAPKPEAR